ncbi:TraB/GumN family protein [Variovorax sp. 770b2]|uniref:TraB/GumN family protein n=1 Tax=Variovorax sp. 770b2 TaxID=1566271 RepID=UPI0015A671FF|nr:TraB/GumN family protein [Variovorax sp. 770b2]
MHPSSLNAYNRAVAAIASGHYEDVNAAVDSLAANAADAARHNRVMVSDRNHAWLKRLTPWLDEGGAFVNVGAAHLSGQEGLLTLLAAHGYHVEVIELPARVD